MPRGYALCVGLKAVDPAAYGGTWTGEGGCWGCEADAATMASLLHRQRFDVSACRTERATRGMICAALSGIVQAARAEDFVVFTYSGHGSWRPDQDGDEHDGRDETLCAYDGQLVDDELSEIWAQADRGLRVLMIADSCHSGTVARALPLLGLRGLDECGAQVIHLSACRDEQTAAGYRDGGAFTKTLAAVWSAGFRGTHRGLLEETARAIPFGLTQEPQYSESGPVLAWYRDQEAFEI